MSANPHASACTLNQFVASLLICAASGRSQGWEVCVCRPGASQNPTRSPSEPVFQCALAVSFKPTCRFEIMARRSGVIHRWTDVDFTACVLCTTEFGDLTPHLVYTFV